MKSKVRKVDKMPPEDLYKNLIKAKQIGKDNEYLENLNNDELISLLEYSADKLIEAIENSSGNLKTMMKPLIPTIRLMKEIK